VTRLPDPIGVYGILDAGTLAPDRLPAAGAALAAAGVRVLQVRAKDLAGGALAALVRDVRQALPEGVLLLVNDRADVARATGADGVHVGDEDLPVADARRALQGGAAPALVGFSTHSVAEAAAETDADYIGLGPIFPSGTKVTGRPTVGLEGLRDACARASRPVVAIGGIRLQDVAAVRRAGASGVALIGDLLVAGEVEARARQAVAAFAAAGGADGGSGHG
jgi:thiamine-phosphate pyrophosphorylase